MAFVANHRRFYSGVGIAIFSPVGKLDARGFSAQSRRGSADNAPRVGEIGLEVGTAAHPNGADQAR